MGMSLSTTVFFGIYIGSDEDDDLPKCIRDEGAEDEYTYHELNEKLAKKGLEVTTANYYDYSAYYLTKTSCIKTSDGLDPIKDLARHIVDHNPIEICELLKVACKKHGIPFSEPAWIATSSYF